MSMAFEFTLVAASYTTATATYSKPFSITLGEGDPRIREFRGNPAFKEEKKDLADSVIPRTSPSETGGDADSSFSTLLESVVRPNVAKAIIEAGYASLADLESAEVEKLTEIKGVGEPTAKKLLALGTDSNEE